MFLKNTVRKNSEENSSGTLDKPLQSNHLKKHRSLILSTNRIEPYTDVDNLSEDEVTESSPSPFFPE
jgi:hypothetical protein